LKALEEQCYPPVNFEIIVVNNNAYDSIPAGFSKPNNCTIIIEGKSGSYAARNAGLAIAVGEYIGFTDSDCKPDRNWIKNAVEAFVLDESLQRIGGRINIFSRTPGNYNSIELYETVFAFQQDLYVRKYGACVTGNLFTKRSTFDTVGWFNDTLMSGGDFEWGIRASKANLKIVYGDNVAVNHPARYKFSDLAQKSRRVAGGHFKTHEESRGALVFYLSLVKKLIPLRSELKLIFLKPNLSIQERLTVFYIRYKLQLVYNYTLFQLRRGQLAERF
jgi:GT2 family glycosyltransferase